MRLNRLKKSWEFRRVYRYGRTVVSRNIVLYYCPNRLGINRIGFSISKKVGKSVIRNRIRRVYREAFIKMEDKLVKGYDFIIVARKPAVSSTFIGACEELLKLCRKGQLVGRCQ